MKRLLICRHAKTESADLPKPDRERELTERGRSDAARLAALVNTKAMEPDVMLVSDSRRTRQTCEVLCGVWDSRPEVFFLPELYGASQGDVMSAIGIYGGTATTVMVVGHNPTLEDLASTLVSATVHLKTSWTAVIETDANRWSQMGDTPGRLLAVLKPDSL